MMGARSEAGASVAETKQFEGRTEEEAVAEASSALGIDSEDLDYTVMDEGSDGVLGLGKRPVQIRVRVPDDFEDEEGEEFEDEDETGEVEDGDQGTPSRDGLDDAGAEDGGSGGIVGPAPEKAAAAKEVAEGLASRMGIACKVDVRDEDRQIVVLIDETGEGSTDVADILGRSRPPAIPSFQFLLNKIVNRFPDDRKHIVVEVPSVPRRERKPDEGGRYRNADGDDDLDPTLVELARMLADRALELNRVITVHPMAAADRRAVHKTIMSISGAQTVSEGEGLYRRIHIVPDALKDDGQKRKRRRRRRRRGPNEDGEGSVDVESSENADAGESDED